MRAEYLAPGTQSVLMPCVLGESESARSVFSSERVPTEMKPHSAIDHPHPNSTVENTLQVPPAVGSCHLCPHQALCIHLPRLPCLFSQFTWVLFCLESQGFREALPGGYLIP